MLNEDPLGVMDTFSTVLALSSSRMIWRKQLISVGTRASEMCGLLPKYQVMVITNNKRERGDENGSSGHTNESWHRAR
jgi:hypothetical protein